MHVLDASRAVAVCESLLNEKKKDEFVEDVREQYAARSRLTYDLGEFYL